MSVRLYHPVSPFLSLSLPLTAWLTAPCGQGPPLGTTARDHRSYLLRGFSSSWSQRFQFLLPFSPASVRVFSPSSLWVQLDLLFSMNVSKRCRRGGGPKAELLDGFTFLTAFVQQFYIMFLVYSHVSIFIETFNKYLTAELRSKSFRWSQTCMLRCPLWAQQPIIPIVEAPLSGAHRRPLEGPLLTHT